MTDFRPGRNWQPSLRKTEYNDYGIQAAVGRKGLIMTTEQIVAQFRKLRIIPVIAMQDANDSEALAGALTEGGLPAAEVTFRTPAAAETIRRMCAAHPDMMVGAGTVLTIANADAAIEAGAKFIVSPGLNPKIVQYCLEQKIPFIPGVATASEIEQAMDFGLHAVKFFPAEAMGGLKTIKALCGPYTEMEFMPTGGVTVANVKDYLAFDKIYAVGGSWIVKNELLAAKDFATIQKNAAEAVALSR